MKGFICDKCNQTQDGKPNLFVGDVELDLRQGLVQHAQLQLRFSCYLPGPDLCEKCKREIAEEILKHSK